MSIGVKICGLTKPEHVKTASDAGAKYVGFVIFRGSPRYIEPEAAAQIAKEAGPETLRIAVLVDPSDSLIDKVVSTIPIEGIQLHGTETPDRVSSIRNQTKLTVIKAVSIEDRNDIKSAHIYEQVTDMLLFDAKPRTADMLPGGNAMTFDWKLIAAELWGCPWFLSGGLNAENIMGAINVSHASLVDVSSGVEKKRGVKDLERIRSFMRTVGSITL